MADFTIDTEDTVYEYHDLLGRFDYLFSDEASTDDDFRVLYVVRDIVAQLVKERICGPVETPLAVIVDVDATSITITLDADPPAPG